MELSLRFLLAVGIALTVVAAPLSAAAALVLAGAVAGVRGFLVQSAIFCLYLLWFGVLIASVIGARIFDGVPVEIPVIALAMMPCAVPNLLMLIFSCRTRDRRMIVCAVCGLCAVISASVGFQLLVNAGAQL